MAKRHPPESTDNAEAQVFRAAVQDVKPLPRTAVRVAAKKPTPRKAVRISARASAASASAALEAELPLLAPSAVLETDASDSLSFHRSGVRDPIMRRLRRGGLPVESELDLHGMTQAHARGLLVEFLQHAESAGMRCVRIIHGKGMRSGSRGAVLKAAVNTWLRHHPAVLAFTSARPLDGGTGAAYVLLRG